MSWTLSGGGDGLSAYPGLVSSSTFAVGSCGCGKLDEGLCLIGGRSSTTWPGMTFSSASAAGCGVKAILLFLGSCFRVAESRSFGGDNWHHVRDNIFT